MIIFRQKDFATKNQLKSSYDVAERQIEPLIGEIIKLVEFYDLNVNMVHWIDNIIVGDLFKTTIESDNYISDCFVRAEDNLNTPQITNRFGKSISNLPHGKSYIKYALLKFTKGKEWYNKYRDANYREILDNSFSESMRKEPDKVVDYYQKIMKYIALSFTGQINPEHESFWEIERKLGRMSVDYESTYPLNTKFDKAELDRLFAKCLISIKSYENDKIGDLLR